MPGAPELPFAPWEPLYPRLPGSPDLPRLPARPRFPPRPSGPSAPGDPRSPACSGAKVSFHALALLSVISGSRNSRTSGARPSVAASMALRTTPALRTSSPRWPASTGGAIQAGLSLLPAQAPGPSRAWRAQEALLSALLHFVAVALVPQPLQASALRGREGEHLGAPRRLLLTEGGKPPFQIAHHRHQAGCSCVVSPGQTLAWRHH